MRGSTLSASRQAQLVKLAREALTSLVSKPEPLEPLRRMDIFTKYQGRGPLEKSQVQVLKALEQTGIIESAKLGHAGHGGMRVYALKDSARAKKALASDVEMSAALWPTRMPAPVEQESSLGVLGALEVLGTYTESPVVVPATPPPPPSGDTAEVLQALLLVLKAVNQIGEAVSGLAGQLDALRDVTNSLRGEVRLLSFGPDAPAASTPAVVSDASARLGEDDALRLKAGDSVVFFDDPLGIPVMAVVVGARQVVGKPTTVTISYGPYLKIDTTPRHLGRVTA